LGLLSGIGRFFRRTDDKPPKIVGNFRAGGAVGIVGIQHVDDDLYGITFAMEYRDARGSITTRRV
jgi:hypothetical protein